MYNNINIIQTRLRNKWIEMNDKVGIIGLYDPKVRAGLDFPNSTLLCLVIFPDKLCLWKRNYVIGRVRLSSSLLPILPQEERSPPFQNPYTRYFRGTWVVIFEECASLEPVNLSEDSGNLWLVMLGLFASYVANEGEWGGRGEELGWSWQKLKLCNPIYLAPYFTYQ